MTSLWVTYSLSHVLYFLSSLPAIVLCKTDWLSVPHVWLPVPCVTLIGTKEPQTIRFDLRGHRPVMLSGSLSLVRPWTQFSQSSTYGR